LTNRSINIFANAKDNEEMITATINLQSLNYIQSKRSTKKNVNWEFIAKEYAQLAGIHQALG
jgi:hypothetical protein